MRTPPPIDELRQDDGELAIADRRPPLRDVERSGEPDCARKAPELTLDHVVFAVLARWRRLLADHDQDLVTEQDAHGGARNARRIHQDLDGSVRLQDVDRRPALTGERALALRERGLELLEQPPDVSGERGG